MSLQLSEQDIQALVRRAHEIDAGLATSGSGTTQEAFLDAAEEAGISRAAAEAALRERLGTPALDSGEFQEFAPGTLVLVTSPDGLSYPARIVKQSPEQIQLRYVNGTESIARPDQVRMFSIAPGQQVSFNSSTYMSWVQGSAIRFNSDALTLTVSYWGMEETVPLDIVRLPKEGKHADWFSSTTMSTKAQMIAIGIGSALAGTGIGMVLTKLLMK